MKRSSSSSTSSLLARAVSILVVIVCCCSLMLPCPCYANDKLGHESGGGKQEGAGNRQGFGPPSPWHNAGYGMSYPPYGQVSRND
ncbi:hypothetical protein ZWY2020_031230 [Hordeum vulgare]|nr:hypothetical protein ZWY2020_031230 [Hordeum vulgare]